MDKAHLIWVNNNAFKNDYFEVQRSDEKGVFRTLEVINEQYFDAQLHTYRFTDTQMAEGDNLYRIKASYKTGENVYSEIKTIQFVSFTDAVVFPNPTSNKIYISLKRDVNQSVNILIYNQLGISVKELEHSHTSDLPIEMSVEGLPNGMYFMRITSVGKKDIVKKIFISE